MSKDITGKRFGRLIVVRKTDQKPKDRYLWECICDCGNTVYLPANGLKSGNNVSCGCKLKERIINIDFTGQRIGKLLIVKKSESSDGWICLCDCGNEIIVKSRELKHKNTKSCGCLNNELLRERNKKMATHRMSNSRLYGIWAKMKVRCTKIENKDYDNYGARGISFYKEWESFEPFMEWAMNNGYNEKLTLDRIDVNGDYEPDNCRWITMKEQASNKRTSRYIEVDGVKRTVAEWARIIGVSRQGLRYRLEAGWSIEDIISEKNQGNPRKKKEYSPSRVNMLTIKGITKPMLTWAEEIGITYCSLKSRVEKGWDDDKLLLPKFENINKNNV